ncbi:hypothetical protein GCM10009811_34690 [Nostocoides veronense]|uniref:Uncharacterized protein n=1 Tax=Nostocoides veronense TaxID=330836 RepID=A0ABN2M3M5_9MICO
MSPFDGVRPGVARRLSAGRSDLVAADPSLRLVRGWYHDPQWGAQAHWWAAGPDGTIHDPTAAQFPIGGIAACYQEFDGWGFCYECGHDVHEDDAYGAICGSDLVCSGYCYGHPGRFDMTGIDWVIASGQHGSTPTNPRAAPLARAENARLARAVRTGHLPAVRGPGPQCPPARRAPAPRLRRPCEPMTPDERGCARAAEGFPCLNPCLPTASCRRAPVFKDYVLSGKACRSTCMTQ